MINIYRNGFENVELANQLIDHQIIFCYYSRNQEFYQYSSDHNKHVRTGYITKINSNGDVFYKDCNNVINHFNLTQVVILSIKDKNGCRLDKIKIFKHLQITCFKQDVEQHLKNKKCLNVTHKQIKRRELKTIDFIKLNLLHLLHSTGLIRNDKLAIILEKTCCSEPNKNTYIQKPVLFGDKFIMLENHTKKHLTK